MLIYGPRDSARRWICTKDDDVGKKRRYKVNFQISLKIVVSDEKFYKYQAEGGMDFSDFFGGLILVLTNFGKDALLNHKMNSAI